VSYQVHYYCKHCLKAVTGDAETPVRSEDGYPLVPAGVYIFQSAITYGGLRIAGQGMEALDAEEAEHLRAVHPEQPCPTPAEYEAERDAYYLRCTQAQMKLNARWDDMMNRLRAGGEETGA
jgi:hypothetical protein